MHLPFDNSTTFISIYEKFEINYNYTLTQLYSTGLI